MASSTEQAEDWPATPDGPADVPRAAAQSALPGTGQAGRVPDAPSRGEARPEDRRGNGFATAAIVLGATGVTLVTIVPGLVFGILGLRRAGHRGTGRVRSWLGIGLCLLWTAAAIYLVPHLVRAADPGCSAYKGSALTAYNRAIADFNGNHTTPNITRDVARATSALETAADRSRDPAAARALNVLTRDLRAVLDDLHTGAVVPESAMQALNRDTAHADAACGTLHV
jgi:hypothetical protein